MVSILGLFTVRNVEQLCALAVVLKHQRSLMVPRYSKPGCIRVFSEESFLNGFIGGWRQHTQHFLRHRIVRLFMQCLPLVFMCNLKVPTASTEGTIARVAEIQW